MIYVIVESRKLSQMLFPVLMGVAGSAASFMVSQALPLLILVVWRSV